MISQVKKLARYSSSCFCVIRFCWSSVPFLTDAYKDNYYRGLFEIGHAGKVLPSGKRNGKW